MGAQGDGGFLRVASALSTLQQGLNHDARQHVSSPTLLHAAQALLQLSTAAVGKAGASDLLPSSPFHDDEHLQQKQQQHTLTKADSTSSSSGAHRQSLSSTGRRSSLRSAADARHRVGRRSVSFKATSLPLEHEQDTLNAAPPAATAPNRAQDSDAAAASAAERTYSDLVLELPGASAALLSQALLGSSSVTLEVDLVMHGGKQHPTAAEPLNSNSDADHSDSSMHQGEEAAFVRTPSGHMVRRTSSSVGLPLSASGKEVWRQVRLSEAMQHSQGPCNKQSVMHVCTWQHHQQTCMCFLADKSLLLVLSASGADTSVVSAGACPAPVPAHVVLHFTVEAAPQVTCHKSVVHA